MSREFECAEAALRKVLESFKEDGKLLLYLYHRSDSPVLTVRNLEISACNHLFDDYPHRFGITELDGHIIRAYFHNTPDYEYIRELHNIFPDIFEPENKKYMNYVNNQRRRKNLSEIDVPVI